MQTYGILNAIAITVFAILGIYVFARAAKEHTRKQHKDENDSQK